MYPLKLCIMYPMNIEIIHSLYFLEESKKIRRNVVEDQSCSFINVSKGLLNRMGVQKNSKSAVKTLN